jgi:site-specific DNA recombinase
MGLARTYAIALMGVTGHLVEVEAHIGGGLPATILVGLPDTAVREARDRVRAALVNSQLGWPGHKITVGLSPASLPKHGSGFDLAIDKLCHTYGMGQDQDEYVAYYRKSKGRAGIARQRAATEALVSQRGGRIIRGYTDTDRTAYQAPGEAPPKRKDFDALIAHLAAVPGLKLAAWHADRLLRNGPDTERVINTCAAGDHLVITARGGDYDLGTATGRKRIRNDAIDAQYEVDHAIERITAQKAEARAEGRWLGGRRPFGWQPDPEAPGGLALDEAEHAAIADAAAAVLKGTTTGRVARQWNDAGTLTATRSRWTPNEVRRVLTRESNWAPPPARWPPLVDADTHRALRGILLDPARRTTPGPEVAHLLSGIARCGMCWEPMNASSTKRETSRLVYRCRNGIAGREGDHVARSLPALDAYVTETVIAWFELNGHRFLAAPAASPLPALQGQRDAVDLAMKSSNDLRRQGLLTDAEFAAERRDHQARAAQLDALIAAARSAGQLADMAVNPRQAWESRDLGQKRAVIRKACEIVVIPQAKGRPKGWKPGQPYLDPDAVKFGWKR